MPSAINYDNATKLEMNLANINVLAHENRERNIPQAMYIIFINIPNIA